MPKSSKKFKLDLTEVPDFEVFVQSTSVNRVLLPGTEFLYEIEEEEEGTVSWGRGGEGRGGEGRGREGGEGTVSWGRGGERRGEERGEGRGEGGEH